MRTTKEHIKCGLHSEIPKCCITFYITFWQFMLKKSKFVSYKQPNTFLEKIATKIHKKYYDVLNKKFDKPIKYKEGYGTGYIVCPICFVLNRYKPYIKNCNCAYTCKSS